jgi:thiamine biosynthesis lipoprotein
MSHTTGTWVLPAEAGPLLSLYRTLYEATDGAVTPLVGRTLENLGYDRNYSLRATGVATSVPRWEDTFQWDGHALTTHTPTLLDVGAAGKGYLVDLVAATLIDADISEFVIDASGDIVHSGTAPIRVALEHPRDPSKAIGVLELRNGALCASSTSRRAWGDGLHHIIDPVTGLPTTAVIATWVRATDGLTADGLATALFFVGASRLTDTFDFTYARMFSDGRVEHSPDFDGELFL